MAKFNVTPSNSPFTLNLANLGTGNLPTEEVLILTSGDGLVLNLPSAFNLQGSPKVKVINLSGDVTVNGGLLQSSGASAASVSIAANRTETFNAVTGVSDFQGWTY